MKRYTIRPLWLQAFAVAVAVLFAYALLLASLPRLVFAVVLLLDWLGIVAVHIDAGDRVAGELFRGAVLFVIGCGMAAISIGLIRQPYDVRVSHDGEIKVVRLLTRSTLDVGDIRRIERLEDDQLRLTHGDRTTSLDLDLQAQAFIRDLRKLNPEIVVDYT